MKYSVYVSKKEGFDVEAGLLNKSFSDFIKDYKAESIQLINHYLVETDEEIDIKNLAKNIFAEPNVDIYSVNHWDFSNYSALIPIRYLPGQYDQRADSAAQCLEIMAGVKNCRVRTAKIYCFKGEIQDFVLEKIKSELINKVESKLCSIEELNDFEETDIKVEPLKHLDFLMNTEKKGYVEFIRENGLAMSEEDLAHVIKYFKSENRIPNLLEIKVLDTYWSDHCRHTTFNTKIDDVKIKPENKLLNDLMRDYYQKKNNLGRENKPITLMDIATINAKTYMAENPNHNIDISEEINACSINIKCKMKDGSKKPVLLMFKNETHNHPTEIEPFGGAATCLGGAIRDPLSGRAYVYGAIRVTGAGDPTVTREETLEGKLPQYKICRESARGYSSYGNQIGISTGIVREFYHQGFLAKRFELGAVIASAPKENVKRKQPKKGDIVVLVGGKTGRDGVGGATGSSKSHDEKSLVKSGSEVQKGNAPEERKLLRLFMNPEAAKMIKRCNDFGAGGVAVAVGEISPSIDIDLDAVPKKYSGLNAMETAISESQERMAVVIEAKNWEAFDKIAHEENLEATIIANITDTGRLRMFFNNETVLDFSREFLDSGGVERNQSIDLTDDNFDFKEYFSEYKNKEINSDFLINSLKNIKNASQKGLIEMFDSSIGTGSVFSPLGGKYRMSPSDVMVNKIPVGTELAETMSAMTFGYEPYLAEKSPLHGGYYSVVMSIAKLVASGFSNKKIKLSLQEYFEKLGNNPKKWAKPFLALLGAMKAQFEFNVAAIGGKDSMSGTFNDINVPPSLVSFAVSYGNKKPIPNTALCEKSRLYLILPKYREDGTLDNEYLLNSYKVFLKNRKKILSAKAIDHKGLLINIYEMLAGNRPYAKINEKNISGINSKAYGGIIFQSKDSDFFNDFEIKIVGEIPEKGESKNINIENESIDYDKLELSYTGTLDKVYPIKKSTESEISNLSYGTKVNFISVNKFIKPRVFIPSFPGTNCEYDTAGAFKKAGAETRIVVFRNQRENDISDSIKQFKYEIENAQILALPGGFSAGDEPEGSAKFIASIFKNPELSESINKLIKDRDGLIIGICNGFQALIKLGIFEHGEISEISENSPTLTYNSIGRHVAGIVKVRISSVKSPWLKHLETGDVYNVAISHGEGRFVANPEMMKRLIDNGQISMQYADDDGNASMNPRFNPNGSMYAVEGLISSDGRVLGKMGHTERYEEGLYSNISGKFDENLFKSGVDYFK